MPRFSGTIPTLITMMLLSPAALPEDLAFGNSAVASREELAGMRGGYSTAAGPTAMQISFGVERTIEVGGSPVISTRLMIPAFDQATLRNLDLSGLSAHLGIAQSGSGNSYLPGAVASGSIASVVQNSMDNQTIRQSTVISVGVTVMDTMRQVRMATLFAEQINRSLK